MRPPCQPQPTLRRTRGRVGWIIAFVVVAVLAAFSNPVSELFPSVVALDPGPLSNAHAGFIGAENCAACHDGHESTGLDWWRNVVTEHDNDGRCLQCHAFEGPDRNAHNREFADRDNLPEPGCAACHKEHQGPQANLADVTDVVCGNCHQQQFEDFTRGHPEFAEKFPYQVPNAIYFDHSVHLAQHFPKSEEAADDRPEAAAFAQRAIEDCTACHEIETATREVKPRTFEATCAKCHQQQVLDRQLTLLLADAVTTASALLLGISEDDDDADDKAAELRDALAESGLEAFVEPLETLELADGSALFAGLSPEMVQAAATAWQEEEDYEPPETELKVTGWRAGEDNDGEQSLRYEPRTHRDPVLREWLDALASIRTSHEDEDIQEVAGATLEQFLDASEGPGACGKCHVAGIAAVDDDGVSAPHWGFRGSIERRHTRYAHAPHLNLLGGGAACGSCHEIDESAEYAGYFESVDNTPEDFASNFKAIDKATCEGCHKPEKVRFDCQLCHTYHRKPGFNVGFQIKRLARNE